MNCDPGDTNKASSEDNVLPLELVINKNTKSKEKYYNSISIDNRPPDLRHEDVTKISCFNNNEGAYESTTSNTVSNNDSEKLYIPKIEPSDMVLNIAAHLRNGNDPASLQHLHVRKYQCRYNVY